jgi:hypothetical protein
LKEIEMTLSRSGLIASLLCLAALLALPTILPAQVTFERTYGDTADDYCWSVQQTADGGYIIAGATRSFGAGDGDVYLIKTNPRGDTLWTRTFGGANSERGNSVRQTTDGGYVIAGSTMSFGAGHDDVYLVRTNAAGDTLWTRTFGSVGYDYGSSCQQTADCGFIMTGYTKSFGNGNADVYLIKTDADGDTLWTRTYGDTADDCGWSVQQTADGGYIIAGSTYSYGAGEADIFLIRTDPAGDTLWTRTYGGTEDCWGSSIHQTADGGYVIAGGTGHADVYLVKTDANGDTLWTRAYGGAGDDEGRSVQQTTDSGYVIAGCTSSWDAGGYDVYLIRTDANGDTLWTKSFGGTGLEEGYSVQQTADRGFIVAGYVWPRGTGSVDVYLVKTDSLGRVGIEEPEAPPTRAPALSLTCAPNPAFGSVTISLSPSISSSLSSILHVFDAQGRLVLSQPVRTSPFILHPSSLPAGVYLVRLDCGTHHASARLVLQR